MTKIIEKPLVVKILEDLHHEMKKQALFKHITIKQYVTEAILEKIKKEAEYQ
jgi:predicted HicB family RNase H-like nuclease